MSLPTHPTCMNASSFSLTRSLAEVGQSLLGETEAQRQPGPPAHRDPAEHGACSWPGTASSYGIWHLEQCQGQPGCSCTRSTQMVPMAPSFASGEDSGFHGSWHSFSRHSDIHQKKVLLNMLADKQAQTDMQHMDLLIHQTQTALPCVRSC